MSDLEIVDTFPAFFGFWTEAREKAIEGQIELWASEYLAAWPELLDVQVEDYAEQGLDWRQVAREKVFPFLQERLPAMQEARSNLLRLSPVIFSKAEQVLNFKTSICFVIHVGIGCGAGWVTIYQNKYSILFGLENIAECGWSDPEAITGLVCHEIGHVIHYDLRSQNDKRFGSDAWWQLYSEGFAQHCETLINYSLHQEAQDGDWTIWCQQNKKRLAAEFIKAADRKQAVNAFFGSWFDIEGHSETGYFLGHEVIKEFATKLSIREIALLDDFENYAREILERMTQED